MEIVKKLSAAMGGMSQIKTSHIVDAVRGHMDNQTPPHARTKKVLRDRLIAAFAAYDEYWEDVETAVDARQRQLERARLIEAEAALWAQEQEGEIT